MPIETALQRAVLFSKVAFAQALCPPIASGPPITDPKIHPPALGDPPR